MPRLWIADDAVDHHHAARATLARMDVPVELTCFASGSAVLDAITTVTPDEAPHAVLMDYYLGDDRGDQVTAELRRLQPQGVHPLVVGYSSVPACSRLIVEAGGDTVVKKRIACDGTNPDLRDWLARWLATGVHSRA